MTDREFLWLAFGVLIGYLVWEEWGTRKHQRRTPFGKTPDTQTGQPSGSTGLPPKCNC